MKAVTIPSLIIALLGITCSSEGNSTDDADVAQEVVQPIEVAEDAKSDPGLVDTAMDPSGDMAADQPDCHYETPPTTPMGGPCESDCDCPPELFCYLEAYPGASHVCTRECDGDCGDPNEYKCLIFSPKHWDKHKLTHHTICMPSCLSMADCQTFGDHFNHCPGKSAYTVWEDSTLAPSTCQVVKTE